MSFETMLNTLVSVERKSPTKDASGGQVENWAEVAALADLPACVQAHHGHPRAAQAQRQVVISHMVYLSDASAVLRGDRLYEPSTGRRFLSHGAVDMGGRGRCWRVECTQVT